MLNFIDMFKKIFFQIHWFLGITAGLILSIMGISGAIYSYDQQILKWINSESYIVEIQQQDKLTPTQIYQHFIQQDPKIKINSITIDQDPAASSTINIVKEGERRGYNMMINPYNAEVLPEIKGRDFFQFIQRLHRYLTMGDFGKQLTGASTLMLIFFVLSGIYLRWPKKHSLRQWIFVKPKLKGRNFIWDLHAVVGTWVIVFYLIFAVTGLYWSYDWWRNGMFNILGVERPQMTQNAPPQANPNQGNQRQQENTNNRSNMRSARGERSTAIDSAQISFALNQTWVGFNQQLNHAYSSMTLTLPKRNDGKIEISFVDQVAQHERARNSATYNYQNASIEKIELYQDKKLNEKIMSSMLPVHRGSFMGPIYQFFAMLASLAMPLFFVTGWMLYLKRRKQKKLTQQARSHSNTANFDPNTQQWTIFYASQTGMAEQVAYNTSSALQQAGIATQVKVLRDCSIEELERTQNSLFIVSTYGTGEAPDLALSFVKKSMTKSTSLPELNYAVLALGSKEYAETYCTFGHTLNAWLRSNQAQSMFDIIEVDNGNKTDLEQWYNALANITKTEIEAVINEKTFDTWQLLSRHILNKGSQGEPAFDLKLKALHDESWHAGDIAEIQPGNSDQRIDNFIQQHQLTASANLIEILRYKDLTQFTVEDGFDTASLSQLPNLPSREYSIASIPQENQLQLVVRQKHDVNGLGLGSGWLTEHTTIDSTILMRIRTNPSFHLITDNRPIILLGNGTGIAGLLSLLKQREQLGFKQNWLIFGERNASIDYFYQAQITTWLENSHLQHVDLAFSRDQEQRIYVQHKMREHAQRLQDWIAQDAVIYVCGSIDGMASGVDQALTDILGEEQINILRQNDRYRRDVY